MEGEDPLLKQCQQRVGSLVSGKYRLDALIGVGGMAAVYMATHRNGSLSAVKLLHDEVALNEEIRERFLREAYIANKVGHPGTVKVIDDDADESGTPYLVMELLQGKSVEAVAEDQGGRLTASETLNILDQTLAVLESAHANKIVHRDLKPENLFLTSNGQVKVLDFGIARLREDNARKTQTGMVMGTPSFMAPEQAMGRWSEVDARTDLYAMGATAFTLLTGRPVHEAETAGEMLVAAATRPARSLAKVLNNAPFPLVALIDKALAYERDHRFADASSFRQQLAKVRSELGEEELASAQAKVDAPVVPPTMVGRESELADPYFFGDEEEDESSGGIQSYDPSHNTEEEIEAMANFFTLLERALVATKQYASDHPETKRRFGEAFRELSSALMTCDICLAWNLTPYGFVVGEHVVWEPEIPWNRIPYQLFSDGVRTMGLAPGMDEGEFNEWVRLITLDPTTDLAPEDDLVTLLWDAGLTYAFHQAIDSFAEGNQDQRARYEAERRRIMHGAKLEDVKGAGDAWQDEHGRSTRQRGAARGKAQVMAFLKNEPIDTATAARVANMDLADEADLDNDTVRALSIDESTKALLAARLDVDVGNTSERFVIAAADAYVSSARMGRSAAVATPLRRAVDGLGKGVPLKAMDMVIELREAVAVDGKDAETDSLRDAITSEVLSPPTLLLILRGSLTLEPEAADSYMRGMEKVLHCIQEHHFDAALKFLPESTKGAVREMLLEFLRRKGRGQETKVGELFKTADLDLGLDLVRLLVEIGTPDSKEAVAMASRSPHALVRIEALGHVEGVSGPRLRNELKKLLEDHSPSVRLAALRAMKDHLITAAGPYLVIRIQEKSFLKLPPKERKQGLDTLCALRPKRAEEVCIELLREGSLFRSESVESTREMAAEMLANVATTDIAFYLLDEIAKSGRFKNSKRVREAAQRALDHIAERAQQAKEARAARASQVGRKTGAKKRKRTSKVQSPDGQTAAARRPSQRGTAPAATRPARSPAAGGDQ